MKARDRVLIIAEAGVNHNGSLDLAKQLIDTAHEAGADIVKFQTFKADRLAVSNAAKAQYQQETTSAGETQVEMLKRLELSDAMHFELRDHCNRLGIEFLSTPFDLESVDFLSRKLKVLRIKIPSGEITHGPLLLRAAQTGKPMIVSTGMSSIPEIASALEVIAYGYLHPKAGPPARGKLGKLLKSKAVRALLQKKVTLLHCTSEYPAPFEDVNLRAMQALQKEFGLAVGLSDHSQGIAVPIAAAALGAQIIEKHFTMDRNLPGPDHAASLDPQELKAMIQAIRQVEMALGSETKKPAPSELKNREHIRRSLVLGADVKKGEVLTPEVLVIKRPGTGICPMKYWDYIGKKATRNYKKDDLLT